jgi:hypothetical protein
MSKNWQDNCGTVIQGPRPSAPKDVTIINHGITRPGFFNGENVSG